MLRPGQTALQVARDYALLIEKACSSLFEGGVFRRTGYESQNRLHTKHSDGAQQPYSGDLLDIENAPQADAKRPLLFGVLSLLIAVAAFYAWSQFAPIASATIATGTIVVENSRRTIQHPDGGKIVKINVRDGSLVHKGDTLIVLDGERIRASRDITRQIYTADLAKVSRLVAERDDLNSISIPAVVERLDPGYARMVLKQQLAFMFSRRKSLRARLSATQTEKLLAEEQLAGLTEQIDHQKTRIGLTEKELAAAQTLAKSGAGTQQRVLEISRGLADLEGSLASLRSQAAEARLRIEGSYNDASKAVSSFQESVGGDLAITERDSLELKDRLQALDHQISGLRILAPVDGAVISLGVHTVGGVALAGSPLMDIVPSNEKLVIETELKPEDQNAVHTGDAVEFSISGSSSQDMRHLKGHVLSVSDDRLTDRLKGTSFFIVRIGIDQKEVNRATKRELRPGVAVEVFIFKGEKTPIQYIMEPITKFIGKGLRD